MFKSILVVVAVCLVTFTKGLSQGPSPTAISSYSYHHPSTDKESWQRLNLWLSSCHYNYTSSGMDLDSSLFSVSRSLGLSRLPLIAEGIDDPDLIAQSKWVDDGNPSEGIRMLSEVKGRKRALLLILLGSYYAFQPYYAHRYPDSVQYFLTQAGVASVELQDKGIGRLTLCVLSKLASQAGGESDRNIIFERLLTSCEKYGDKKTAARAFTYRGVYSAYSAETIKMKGYDYVIQQKIGYLEKARTIYQELNDVEGEINVLANIGIFYMSISKFDEAYPVFTRALELQHSIGYPYTHYTTAYLSMVTITQGKFGEPLKYCIETVNTSEKTRDSIGWAVFYSRLGGLYYTEGGKEEESLKWMHKALDRYVKAKDAGLYQDLYNIVNVTREKGGREKEVLDLVTDVSKKIPARDSNDMVYHHMSFALAHLGMKQYRLAEQYALAADSIARTALYESINSIYHRTLIYTTLSSIYYADGQYAKAKNYLDKYLADTSRTKDITSEMMVYQHLIKIDSIFHDAASGLSHYRIYNQLLDSNFKVSKIRQAEELQVLYLTQEKENKIAVLNKEAELKQANLKQATLMRNMTIAGIIVVLVIAGLLYRQSRLRKKNNTIVTHKNEQLQHFLTEKEWLLKEIHHRVKNNLQIVMSLLNSQSAYIDNEPALTAIHDSQHRVHAMSLIHQKLYNTDNVSSIDMSLYIRELVSYLADSYNTGQRIRFEFDIDDLELDVTQAVPLGLILNEAITNSIKYGFPDERDGVIRISLADNSQNNYLLTIADNGFGMPTQSATKKTGSLGMSLMAGLAEDLDGTFEIENDNGTTIKISFVHDTTVKRPGPTLSSFVTDN